MAENIELSPEVHSQDSGLIEPSITPEFIDENRSSELGNVRQKHAPYTKAQRRKRRNEVFRLHFLMGEPAIRIAEAMHVDRNTVNADIRFLYEKMAEDIEGDEWNGYFTKSIVRLETQRTRLLSYLSETKELESKLAIERQLADMDIRLAGMVQKFQESTFAFWDKVVDKINEIAESEGWDVRYTNLYERQKISVKKRKLLDQLLEDGEAKQ